MLFRDRKDAGEQLGQLLLDYRGDDAVVIALPRGGAPVAHEVAEALAAPLDVWVVKKVGAPGHEELGLGAVAEQGVVYLDRVAMELVGVPEAGVRASAARLQAEVERDVRRLRGDAPPPSLEDRTLIVVDDGVATGGTVRAAVESLRSQHPGRIVLAVPIASEQSLDQLAPIVDDVACVHVTSDLGAVGRWYEDFRQVSDEEVQSLLALHRRAPPVATERDVAGAGVEGDASEDEAAAAVGGTPPAFDELKGRTRSEEIVIPTRDGDLAASLTLVADPVGLVVLVHGSGSSRYSPRNGEVAKMLQQRGLSTLLCELLTAAEAEEDRATHALRFDIPLLASRLIMLTERVGALPGLDGLPVGYFGASTGAAVALMAASARPATVGAVVSRGGRPDLAGVLLDDVQAPTLLIVGGEDHAIAELNRAACLRLQGQRRIALVPGATHLFGEPGALEEVARLSGDWFTQQLSLRARLLEAFPSTAASPADVDVPDLPG